MRELDDNFLGGDIFKRDYINDVFLSGREGPETHWIAFGSPQAEPTPSRAAVELSKFEARVLACQWLEQIIGVEWMLWMGQVGSSDLWLRDRVRRLIDAGLISNDEVTARKAALRARWEPSL